jgi:hypothetical protein
MFQTNAVETIEIHSHVQLLYFENRALYEIMWKIYGGARQAQDAHCILVT